MVGPKIDPFDFSKNLEDGMRAVAVCAVISGDSPIDINWFKDGQLLIADNENVTIDMSNGFVSTLTFHRIHPAHTGQYTCVASNSFATANYSSIMIVNVAPYFIVAPKDTQVIMGRDVLIDCEAGGQPVAQIRWKKQVNILTGNSLISKADQLQLDSSGSGVAQQQMTQDTSNTDVHLSDLSSTQQQQKDKTSNLLHHHYHHHHHHQQQQQQEFKTITSNPHIQILENGSMVIRDAELSDGAKYMCQAFNGINPSLSSIIQLDVLSPPQFDIKFETVSVKKGASIRFACAPRGDLPMKLEWRKDGQKLIQVQSQRQTGGQDGQTQLLEETGGAGQQQSKYNILQRNQTKPPPTPPQSINNTLLVAPSMLTTTSVVGSELIMEFVDRGDSSLFTCLASNSIGQDELTYRLIVQEFPDAPINIRVTNVTSDSIRLSWTTPFDGNSPINQYIIEYKQHQDTRPTPAAAAGVDLQTTPAELMMLNQQQQHLTSRHHRTNNQELEHVASKQATTSEWIRLNVPNRQQPANSLLLPVLDQQQQHQIRNSNKLTKDRSHLVATSDHQDNSHLSVILNNLKARTTYHIRLASANSIGQGEFCPQLTITTAVEAPSYRPAEVRAQELSSSSIKVVWRAPLIQDDSAPIKGYYVGYRKYPPPQPTGPIAHQQRSASIDAGQQLAVATAALPPTGNTGNRLVVEDLLNYRRNGSNTLSSTLTTTSNNVINQDQQQLQLQLHNSREDNNLAFATVESNYNNNNYLQSSGANSGQQSGHIEQQQQASQSGQSGLFHEYVINNLEKNTKYEINVWAFNSAGTGPLSETFGTTMKFDRPGQPQLKVVNTRHNSIELRWSISDLNPVTGFDIYYKCEHDDWQETRLTVINSYIIDNLRCGNRYQIYLSAVNSAGRSDPSDVVLVKTDGTVPIAPDKNDFIRANITEVYIDLNQWKSGGCPIRNFNIQYKKMKDANWSVLSDSLQPFSASDTISIPELSTATWYKIQIEATNEAGLTNSEYLFATLTRTGAQLPPLILPNGADSTSKDYAAQSGLNHNGQQNNNSNTGGGGGGFNMGTFVQWMSSDMNIFVPIGSILIIILVISLLMYTYTSTSQDNVCSNNKINHHNNNNNKITTSATTVNAAGFNSCLSGQHQTCDLYNGQNLFSRNTNAANNIIDQSSSEPQHQANLLKMHLMRTGNHHFSINNNAATLGNNGAGSSSLSTHSTACPDGSSISAGSSSLAGMGLGSSINCNNQKVILATMRAPPPVGTSHYNTNTLEHDAAITMMMKQQQTYETTPALSSQKTTTHDHYNGTYNLYDHNELINDQHYQQQQQNNATTDTYADIMSTMNANGLTRQHVNIMSSNNNNNNFCLSPKDIKDSSDQQQLMYGDGDRQQLNGSCLKNNLIYNLGGSLEIINDSQSAYDKQQQQQQQQFISNDIPSSYVATPHTDSLPLQQQTGCIVSTKNSSYQQFYGHHQLQTTTATNYSDNNNTTVGYHHNDGPIYQKLNHMLSQHNTTTTQDNSVSAESNQKLTNKAQTLHRSHHHNNNNTVQQPANCILQNSFSSGNIANNLMMSLASNEQQTIEQQQQQHQATSNLITIDGNKADGGQYTNNSSGHYDVPVANVVHHHHHHQPPKQAGCFLQSNKTTSQDNTSGYSRIKRFSINPDNRNVMFTNTNDQQQQVAANYGMMARNNTAINTMMNCDKSYIENNNDSI